MLEKEFSIPYELGFCVNCISGRIPLIAISDQYTGRE